MRRATIAVVERLNPKATANTSVSSDSVRPTLATALAPRWLTQKTSTTAKSDSSAISSTMGMASRRIARFRFPTVKSWCEPWSDSHTDPLGGCGVTHISLTKPTEEDASSKIAESNEKLRLLTGEAKDGRLARDKHGYYPGRTPLGIRPNVKSKSKCNTKAIGVRRIHKS